MRKAKKAYLSQMSSSNKNFNHLQLSSTDVVNFGNSASQLPEEFLYTEKKVLGLLRELNVKKSSESDNTSALMFKKTAVSIAPSIVKLFSQTISSGTFPCAWKTARIVMVIVRTLLIMAYTKACGCQAPDLNPSKNLTV